MASSKDIIRGFALKAMAISDLVRPELPLAAGVCVVLGQIIASGGLPPALIMFLGFFSGFFISGAAMITNDYFDIDVDRINHPQRPLPSGRISTLEVMIITCMFTVAGFITSALLSPLVLALAIVLWIVGILYNWRFKEAGLPGNMMVAFSVSMTFILGGISAGGLTNGLIWTFSALAFIFDLGEEIAAAAMDMEGDGERAARTIARIYGKKHALRISTLLFASIAVLSFIPFVMGWLSRIYLVIFVPMDLAILYLALKLLTSQTIGEGRTKIRQLYLMMTFFTIAIIAVSVL